MMTLLTVNLLACATCYGDPGSPMTTGLNLAILTMLGVTALVLGGCATFIVVLARRARKHAAGAAGVTPNLNPTEVLS